MDSYLRIGSTSSIFMECVYGNSCVVGEGVDQWMSVGGWRVLWGDKQKGCTPVFYVQCTISLSLSLMT